MDDTYIITTVPLRDGKKNSWVEKVCSATFSQTHVFFFSQGHSKVKLDFEMFSHAHDDTMYIFNIVKIKKKYIGFYICNAGNYCIFMLKTKKKQNKIEKYMN